MGQGDRHTAEDRAVRDRTEDLLPDCFRPTRVRRRTRDSGSRSCGGDALLWSGKRSTRTRE
jgi:hypothetical protein